MGRPKDTPTLAREVVERCRKLASYSEDSGSLRRTFLSAPMREVHQEISSWLGPLGAVVRVDAAGNLRALRPATAPESPRVLIGSHLDTVPGAGAFDGVLGVVLAVAVLEAVVSKKFPLAIEIVGFSEEEGVRFGKPFIGSRALVGKLDRDLLAIRDGEGISVQNVIESFGLDPAEIPMAVVAGDACAFLEFHIEQGPVLERLGYPLAAVEVVAGQTRMDFAFLGKSNHAGTTPMDLRCDTVAGAAEWISGTEALAKGTPGLVATVGSVQTLPGATNVIAGETRLSLDVRHASDAVRSRAVKDLTSLAEGISQKRGFTLRYTTRVDQNAVAMDPFLVGQVAEAIEKTGGVPHRMVSGAGHDAMILAEKVPAAMVFLRTPGGISHNPAESVAIDDVAQAIECGIYLLEQLAASPSFLARTHRA